MAGERGAGRASDPPWWSAGDVPDELPSWARRGLEETPEELAPSAPITPPRRHRRTAGVAGTGDAGSRLRGWGLAVASVAAAAAAVPLAISTLAASDDAYSLPRVGTFPVVAPGSLGPGPAAPGTVTVVPDASGPTDAADLPPLEAPAAVVAAPPRTVVAPRAVTQAEPTTRRTTTRSADTGTTTTEVDATPRRTDTDGPPTSNGQNGAHGSEDGDTDAGTPAQDADDDAAPPSRPSVLGGLLGGATHTVTGAVGSVVR